MKLEFHPEAEKEFLEAVSYYEAQVPGLGERFDAEVRTASAVLLEYPEIGPPIDAELRKVVLRPLSVLPDLQHLSRNRAHPILALWFAGNMLRE